MKNAITLNRARQRRTRLNRRRSPRPTSGHTGGNPEETQASEEGLPVFTTGIRVEEESGLFDRLEIDTKYDSFTTSTAADANEEIDIFRLRLGAPPENERGTEEAENYGLLCNVAPDNGRDFHPLKIRRRELLRNGNIIPPPLFSGTISTYRCPVAGGAVRCNLSSRLTINPTEAMNHWLGSAGKRVFQDWRDLVFQTGSTLSLRRALNGKTNLVPDSLLRAAPEAQFRFIGTCFRAVQNELLRARELSTGEHLEVPPQANSLFPKTVETYWEFSSDNAPELLQRLKKSLKAFQRHARERTHGYDQICDQNAQTVTLFLGNGEQVSIYAKTMDRLRVEVRHTPRKQNGLIQDGDSHGYMGQDINDFFIKLKLLRKRAAVKVNELLRFVDAWMEESPEERASRTSYAAKWFATLGFSDSSQHLLTLLKENGRIVAGQSLPVDMASILKRANKAGLIYRDEVAKVYLPASAESLTSIDTSSRVLGHDSETQNPQAKSENLVVSTPRRGGERVLPSPPPFLLVLTAHESERGPLKLF